MVFIQQAGGSHDTKNAMIGLILFNRPTYAQSVLQKSGLGTTCS